MGFTQFFYLIVLLWADMVAGLFLIFPLAKAYLANTLAKRRFDPCTVQVVLFMAIRCYGSRCHRAVCHHHAGLCVVLPKRSTRSDPLICIPKCHIGDLAILIATHNRRMMQPITAIMLLVFLLLYRGAR